MNAVVLGEDHEAASSGSDSGWTFYLQHSSSLSPPPPPSTNNTRRRRDKSYRRKMIPREDVHENDACYNNYSSEEEDLSMISDASSGPPHFDLNDVVQVQIQVQAQVQEGHMFGSVRYGGGERNNVKQLGDNKYCKLANYCNPNDLPHLDDTASSPLFFSPKKKNEGGIYNVKNHQEVSSLESLIDYSNSPAAFSANHFQERSTNFQGGFDHDFLQSSFSADRFQQNQWY